MLRRTWLFLTDSRHLTLIVLLGMAAFFYFGAEALQLALVWAVAGFALALLAGWLAWWLRRRLAAREGKALEEAIAPAVPEVDMAVRDSLLKAIATIRGSKLGRLSGKGALYQLPWYMIIGNPAAGKSSAIANSGLQFPFDDGRAVQGVGGTRNCDWFFSKEGIVLDTAGRYAVEDECRAEWLAFLGLLKRHRRRAPVNGIIVAVSVAELRSEPEASLQLARSLRQRMQDLIEGLEVHAPVYVLFTKADLIAGFGEFFAQAEAAERERVWGATMPYKRKTGTQELLAFFDQAFDELHDGLKEMSVASLAQPRRAGVSPGLFTFPLEFAAMRGPVRAFLATLFEENPFQFKPVLRGFYFTSALQEGTPICAQSRRIAERFELAYQPPAPAPSGFGDGAPSGHFLLKLFRDVIFADKALVSQFASRTSMRLRYAAFAVAVLALGAALGGWTWSYLGNRQLVANVEADLAHVVKLQEARPDLQSRLEALGVLQDRIEQLERFRRDVPWSLGMGLYQGGLLERKLRAEFFAGVREVMLKPVTASLEALLFEMNANAGQLTAAPAGPAPERSPAPAGQYVDANPLHAGDAYNALKTYLMLADPERAEAGHLNDQLTRHWRGWLEANRGAMPREQMIRGAERLLAFHLARMGDPFWPRVEQKLTLVDQSRENLRRVVRGMPARDRVYGEIRARAGTRFPAMTVARVVGEQDQALLAGSHAIPGAFTREAWRQYVEGAIRDAASRELQSTDWVLKTASKDDLTLEGSPEQIQKTLVDMYLAEKAAGWGDMPLHLWLRSVLREPGAVAQMDELLGVAPPRE